MGCQWGGWQRCQGAGWVPQLLPPAAWAWQPSSELSPAWSPISLRFEGSQRGEGDPKTSRWPWAPRQPPAFHQPRELHGGAWILTGLAADLIVAVAACVQPGWVAPLVPGHLDRVLLESPDKALHQAKLDEPPGDEEGREWDRDAETSNTPAPPVPFWFHHSASLPQFPHLQIQRLGIPSSLPHTDPATPGVTATLRDRAGGAGSDLSSTLCSCRV